MVGVGHLGAHGEGSRLGVDLRVGEIDQPPQRIARVVGQGDGDVGVPAARGILLPQIDIALLAAQVVHTGHAEIDTHRIALDNGRQQRLAARPHEGSDVGVAGADIARDGRLYGGVAQRRGRLHQVGFAHQHVGRRALVGGRRIVQIELAGGILRIERADAFQVALGLLGQCAILVELRLGLVHAGAVDLGVDDEERLPLLHVASLAEEHPFEITLHAGPHLDELLRTDAPHELAVDLHVLRGDRLDRHDRIVHRLASRTEQPHDTGHNDDRRQRDHDPPASGSRTSLFAPRTGFTHPFVNLRNHTCPILFSNLLLRRYPLSMPQRYDFPRKTGKNR